MDRDAGTRSRGTFLQHPLVLQINLFQSFEVFWVWFGPQAALRRLQNTLRDGAQRPGVGLLHEVPYLLVEDVFPGYVAIHPVLDDASCGVVAEEVVHGSGELEGALVAVALHGRYPLRVGDAAPEDATGLFGEIPCLHPRRVCGVSDVRLRVAARKGADGRDHTSVVLKVVIRVEEVVLAVVYVLYSDLRPAQVGLHSLPRRKRLAWTRRCAWSSGVRRRPGSSPRRRAF